MNDDSEQIWGFSYKKVKLFNTIAVIILLLVPITFIITVNTDNKSPYFHLLSLLLLINTMGVSCSLFWFLMLYVNNKSKGGTDEKALEAISNKTDFIKNYILLPLFIFYILSRFLLR